MDLDTLPAADRSSHFFDAQYLAKELLDTYDVLVALGGNSLDSTIAPAGDPMAASEAAASPSPETPPSPTVSSTQDPAVPDRKLRTLRLACVLPSKLLDLDVFLSFFSFYRFS